MPKAIIFSDGSADNSNGDGGWASIVRSDNSLVELGGYDASTTSNRMELTAAIEGLKYLSIPHEVELIADSSYLLKTLKNKWYEKWKLEDHRTKPRPNMDLWEQLEGLVTFHTVTFVKVKGHSGDYWNTRADRLANHARKEKSNVVNKLDEFKDVRCIELSIAGKQCKLHIGHTGVCAFGNGTNVKPYGDGNEGKTSSDNS